VVVATISDIFNDIEIRVVKPVSIEKEHINAYYWESDSGTYSRIQINGTSLLPEDLTKTYIAFPDESELFLNQTALLVLEDAEDRIYVYSGMQKSTSAYYSSLPKSGGIKEKRIPLGSHEEAFSLSKVETEKEAIKLTLRQKFGQIRHSEGIIHNLPDIYEFYVNRPKKEHLLVKRLKHRRAYSISLSGGGGYGKTELVKRVVWDIIANPDFEEKDALRYDLVIWISAKETQFEKGEIKDIHSSFRNVEDFLDCVLYVTNNLQYIHQPESYKRNIVCSILNFYESSLLIIDNLETVPDKNSLWMYIDILLRDITSHIKIIVTSRVDDFTFGQHVIPIEAMEDEEAKQLIIEQLDRLGILNRFENDSYLKQIAKISAKSPLLIIFVVQLLAKGYTLDELSKGEIKAYEQALNFICDFQWKELSILARNILMAITVAHGKCSFAQVRQMCSVVNNEDFLSAKEELTQRSFIEQSELENSVLSISAPIYTFVKHKFIEYPHKEDEFTTQWRILNLGETQIGSNSDGIVSFPCDSDEIQLRQLLQKAESLIRINSITYAHEYYKKCVQFFPENAIAWRELAEFEFKYLEDDNKARSSFKKAIDLDPKSPITYRKIAYWEQLRGTEQQIAQYIKRSIEYNKKALSLYTDDKSKRTVNDHIGSSYLKLGEIEKNLGQSAQIFHEKHEHFILSEEYVKLAIKTFEDNIIQIPQNEDDFHHNAIDYNYLASAYPRVARRDKKNAEYYYQKALVCLVKGFQSKQDYDRLLYTMGDHNITRILKSKYNIFVDTMDRSAVKRELIKISDKIEDDFDRMRLKN
jgi:tetratricopeptide (TPR) repeat protein